MALSLALNTIFSACCTVQPPGPTSKEIYSNAQLLLCQTLSGFSLDEHDGWGGCYSKLLPATEVRRSQWMRKGSEWQSPHLKTAQCLNGSGSKNKFMSGEQKWGGPALTRIVAEEMVSLCGADCSFEYWPSCWLLQRSVPLFHFGFPLGPLTYDRNNRISLCCCLQFEQLLMNGMKWVKLNAALTNYMNWLHESN